MKKKSLGKNAILFTLRRLMNVIFPLITFPYVSKVLLVDNLGKYNFAQSIVSYFVLLAGLGVSAYAVREGARILEDPPMLQELFSEIFSINVITMIGSYLLLLLTVLMIPKLHSYSLLIFIFSLEILFQTLGTEWLFIAFEEYTYISFRSILMQVISLICLFLFVRKETDYYAYAAITVLANSGSNLMNLFYAKKLCRIHLTPRMNFRKHIVPMLLIFASTVAVSIYLNSDISLLGALTSDYYVGLYAVSAKVHTIIKFVISAAISVTIPRLAAYLGNQEKEKYDQTISFILNLILVIVIPAMVGIICTGEQIIQLISSNAFLEAVPSLQILSISLPFCMVSQLLAQCVMIPQKKESCFLKATIASAVTNLGLNLFLIPIGKQNAAAVTTVAAEMVQLCMSVHYCRDLIHVTFRTRDVLGIVFGSFVVTAICLILNTFGLTALAYMMIAVPVCAASYFAVLAVSGNSLTLKVLETFFHRVMR